MSESPSSEAEASRRANEAAAWVLRQDRGFTAEEQDAFSAWLAADPRHVEALARHRRHWQRLDQLAQWRPDNSPKPNADLLAPPLRRNVRRHLPWMLACAAAVVIGLLVFTRFSGPPSAKPTPAVVAAPPPGGRQLLPDGSVVELNRDTTLAIRFSANERRVELPRGEAHFVVAKDPSRPFIVQVGGVDVRAVGTVFNVRVGAQALEVLVTEGHVRVTPPNNNSGQVSAFDEAMLAPRQRAVVPLAAKPGAPQIATLTLGEIERVLAWQHARLDFTAAPLSDIVVEFNRRNVVQLSVTDPTLAGTRITASFRSDNLEEFVHLLEAGFGARAERRSETEIILHSAR